MASLLTIITILLTCFQNQLVFPGQNRQGKPETWHVEWIKTEEDQLIPLETKSGMKTFMYLKGHNSSETQANDTNQETCTQDSYNTNSDKKNSVNQDFDQTNHKKQLTEQKKASTNRQKQVILFFYGNGGRLVWCNNLLNSLKSMGGIAASVEYPGYGIAQGRPSEDGCYEAADAAWCYLTEKENILPKNIIVMGHSLGAAVACELAAKRETGGLILCSGFTSLIETAKFHYPFLPVRLLLVYHFDSLKKIPTLNIPILVIHGQCDTVVPFQMGVHNYETALKANLNAEMLTLPNTDHDIFNEEETKEKIFLCIQQFLNRLQH